MRRLQTGLILSLGIPQPSARYASGAEATN